MRDLTQCIARWTLAAAIAILPVVAVSQEAAKTVWSGVYTQPQADRGGAAYAQHCASCHGEALGGGDAAPPLAGPAFLANWAGQNADALFVRIQDTMPLDNPGSLGSATVADIEAFMFARNEFPAGQAEFPAEASGSAAIAITAYRPAS